MSRLEEIMDKNMKARFVDNPCRGIVVGRNDSGHLIQLSWIMGRSPNSQNRIYVIDNGTLRTAAADISKVEDPSLIIYTVMRSFSNLGSNDDIHHIVSNGDQTDSIVEHFALDEYQFGPSQFSDALSLRFCEPDAPTFTPRITGYQNTDDMDTAYISVLAPDPAAKVHWNDYVASSRLTLEDFKKPGIKDVVARELFNLEISRLSGLDHHEFPTIRKTYQLPLVDGLGYCVTTYKEGDHKALNAFEGDPFTVPLRGENLENIMQRFWFALEPEWRVALGGKLMVPSYENIAQPINRFGRKHEDE